MLTDNISKVSPFEAQFGRRLDTPLTNISIEPNMFKMSCKNVVDKYLFQDTLNWTQLILANKCNDPDRCNTERKTNKTNALEDANNRKISDLQGELRLVRIEVQRRQIAGTGKSVQLMIVKKIPAHIGFKKDLKGLYEVLETG